MGAPDQWAVRDLPDNAANCFIQWKGTNLCMDFYCPCGAHGHVDDSFVYRVKCIDCGKVFELGTQVMFREVEDDGSAKPTNNDDESRWK